MTDRLNESAKLQQTLAQVEACALVEVRGAQRSQTGHGLVVCDVALNSTSAVEQLRSALQQMDLRPATPILCLLRDPSHLAAAQAKMAGATATLCHDGSEDLIGAVRMLMRPDAARSEPSSPQAEVKRGVKAAGGLLSKIFGHSTKPLAVSPESLNQASEVLLSSIAQAKIKAWLDVVWTYDDVTYQHCLLVAGLATAFAIELGLPPRSQHILSQAALVHDIGKSKVPRDILMKAGPLTPSEFAVMRAHPQWGHAMLARQANLDPTILDVVRHHHEYLDGSGYPDGLAAGQISRLVRMVTVCDIYAALIERRPYKAPVTTKDALAHLAAMGSKLDGPLVSAFRNVVRET